MRQVATRKANCAATHSSFLEELVPVKSKTNLPNTSIINSWKTVVKIL